VGSLCSGRSAARAKRSDALQTRDPGSSRIEATGIPDQRCTAPLALRAAPHPGHVPSFAALIDFGQYA
jgi:hypothetical protein